MLDGVLFVCLSVDSVSIVTIPSMVSAYKRMMGLVNQVIWLR